MTTEPRIYSWYNEERRVSSVNAGGITGQPHAHAKIAQNELMTYMKIRRP